MKLASWTIPVFAAALMAASMLAQAPANQETQGQAKGQTKGQSKAAPRDPAQSPASRPRPQTVTSQTYSSQQIQDGEGRFIAQCGFCHGRDTAGGESGPDLTRSQLVAEDVRGDKIGILLRTGRPEQGMPAFDLSATDRDAIVAYIH